MKSIKTHIGTFLAAALATGSFIACNSIDYPDRYEKTSGSPTVYYVRYADAEKADVLITGAYYNEIICIVGDNLKSVHKVLFNDVEGTLNSSYITDHTIVMNVASGLPTEKTDKMYLVNYDNDTTAFDFKALAPCTYSFRHVIRICRSRHKSFSHRKLLHPGQRSSSYCELHRC